jgi:metallophosphoesterase superfamily enzyme
VWVAGNHDPEIRADIGGERCDSLVLDGLTLRHAPSARSGEIAGHLHPCAKVRLSGRAIRRRAFVTDGERLVLPAFGSLTGGLNVLDRAWRAVLRPGFRTYLLGETRLYQVARGALCPD